MVDKKKRFLRPDEVAEILQVTQRTVYRMVRDGRLGGVKMGKGPWRIQRENLERMLQNDSPA